MKKRNKFLIYSMGRLTVTPNHPKQPQFIPFLHRKMYISPTAGINIYIYRSWRVPILCLVTHVARISSSDGYRSKFKTGISVSVFFNFVHRYFGMGRYAIGHTDVTEFWYHI